jgi:hypothetical protein
VAGEETTESGKCMIRTVLYLTDEESTIVHNYGKLVAVLASFHYSYV